MKQLVWGLFAVLLATACARTILTRFPHRTHLAELKCGEAEQPACLSCASCHQGDTQHPDLWAVPQERHCSTCHEDSHAQWQKSIRPALATLPDGKKVVFSHDGHLALPELKGQCITCHGGAVGVQGGAPLFPSMDTCLTCHNHRAQFEANECTGCHRPGDLRGLKPVSFLAHDGTWERRHGHAAREQPERCSTCHAQTSCDSCHDSSRPQGAAKRNPERIEANLVHRFDFVSIHALEARAQPGQCVSCHAKTECDACHLTRGVSQANSPGGSPHPPGWASGLNPLTNAHGKEARRDIGSCAACHDQGAASNCVRCHRVGATGGTPHPMGWRNSEPTSSPQCAPCHGGLQ